MYLRLIKTVYKWYSVVIFFLLNLYPYLIHWFNKDYLESEIAALLYRGDYYYIHQYIVLNAYFVVVVFSFTSFD